MQFLFRRKVCKIGILKYPLSSSSLGLKINFCYHNIESIAIVCVNFLVNKCSENNDRARRVSWEVYNTQGSPSHNTTRQAGARKDASGRVRGSCRRFSLLQYLVVFWLKTASKQFNKRIQHPVMVLVWRGDFTVLQHRLQQLWTEQF